MSVTVFELLLILKQLYKLTAMKLMCMFCGCESVDPHTDPYSLRQACGPDQPDKGSNPALRFSSEIKIILWAVTEMKDPALQKGQCQHLLLH